VSLFSALLKALRFLVNLKAFEFYDNDDANDYKREALIWS